MEENYFIINFILLYTVASTPTFLYLPVAICGATTGCVRPYGTWKPPSHDCKFSNHLQS